MKKQLNGLNGEFTGKDGVKVGRKLKTKIKTKIVTLASTSRKNSRKVKHSVPRLTSSPFIASYRAAWSDPFCDQARGCRAPVETGFNTSTYVLKGEIILGNSMSNGGIAIFSNPLCGMLDINSAYGGSACVVSTGMTQLGSSGLYGCTAPSTLAQSLTVYRVVSVGIRIRNPASMTAAQGRIIVAPIICTDDVPNYALMNSTNPPNNSSIYTNFLQCGLPVAYSSACLNFPGSQEYSMAELANSDLTLRLRPISYDSYTFKNTAPSVAYNGTTSLGEETYVTTSTGLLPAPVKTGWSDELSSKGWAGFIINLEGVQTSGSVLAVEYIYHLEGMPAIGASSATPIPSNPDLVDIPPSSTLASVRDWVAKQPAIQWLVDEAGPMAVYAGRHVLSSAGGALMHGMRSAAYPNRLRLR